jgi:hypothetical protein
MKIIIFKDKEGSYSKTAVSKEIALKEALKIVPVGIDFEIIEEKDLLIDSRFKQNEILKKKNQLISIRQTYLKNTDWYIQREADEPDTYPAEIKAKRILARQEINAIEQATTFTALNNFNVNF